MAAPHLSDTEKKHIKERLLKKGRGVAQKLADLKAGQNVDMSSVVLEGDEDEGLKKEDRLRRFLDIIEDHREALLDPDRTYGVCDKCGEPLSYPELEQMPWADTCRGCAGSVA